MSCAGAMDYRLWGRHGWLKRHGLGHVPGDAAPAIRAGRVTVPEARCPLVYAAIAANQDLWLTELARLLKLHPMLVRRATDLLERGGYVQQQGRVFVILKAPGPDWRDYARRAA